MMNDILTIGEVATMLKLSRRTICNLMVGHTNPLPALRIGRSIRFRLSDVNSWLEKLAAGEEA
jgi:excisionase family DNA binding protein